MMDMYPIFTAVEARNLLRPPSIEYIFEDIETNLTFTKFLYVISEKSAVLLDIGDYNGSDSIVK